MQKQVKKLFLIACCFAIFGCSKANNREAKFSITIKDLTAPTITIKKKTYSITEGDSFKIQDCYSVSDNLTEKPTIDIDEGGFSNKKAGTYTIKITATDESGNTAEDSFKVEVKEKPKPTPTPTPTPEETKNNNSSSNSNSSTEKQFSQKSNSSPTQQETQPQVQQQEQSQQNTTVNDSYSEPTTKTDGPYEDANACRSAARSRGAISYKCYDENGQTFLEWEE